MQAAIFLRDDSSQALVGELFERGIAPEVFAWFLGMQAGKAESQEQEE